MDSVIESSCDLSMIFTANSCPVSLETHFLTVLERPLRGKVVRGMGGERGGERYWQGPGVGNVSAITAGYDDQYFNNEMPIVLTTNS